VFVTEPPSISTFLSTVPETTIGLSEDVRLVGARNDAAILQHVDPDRHDYSTSLHPTDDVLFGMVLGLRFGHLTVDGAAASPDAWFRLGSNGTLEGNDGCSDYSGPWSMWGGTLSVVAHLGAVCVDGVVPAGRFSIRLDGFVVRFVTAGGHELTATPDPSGQTVPPIPTVIPTAAPDRVGNAATPAAGGEIIGEWTADQLGSVGLSTDQLAIGVLSDGQLAGLTADGGEIEIVDAAGRVTEFVPLTNTAQQMLVHPGDLAEMITAGGARFWVSLAPGNRGQVVDPPEQATVEGTGCPVIALADGSQWTLPETDCNMVVHQRLLQADGSVLLTGSSPLADHESVQLTATRLDPDGSIHTVVLGGHAVDGAEGWITYQPTSTGGVVLFHYSDDTVVLYRYTFPAA